MIDKLKTILSHLIDSDLKPSTKQALIDYIRMADSVNQMLKDKQAQLEYQEKMIDRHINMLENIQAQWKQRERISMN